MGGGRCVATAHTVFETAKKIKSAGDTREARVVGGPRHVALASAEPEPEPPHRQSGAATAGDNTSMAMEMEPSE